MQTQVEDKRETNTVSIGAGNAPFIINGCTISFCTDTDNSKKRSWQSRKSSCPRIEQELQIVNRQATSLC